MAMEVAAAPWLTEARKFVGLREIIGSRHEAKIVQFFAEAGHSGVKDDETAWCAAFVGAMLRRAGYSSSGALNARSYLNYGTRLVSPKPGCIVVFKRGGSSWQGHVAFFLRDLGDRIEVLGGNQGNAVSIATYSKADLLGYCWPSVKSAPAAKPKPQPDIPKKAGTDTAKVGGAAAAGAVVVGSGAVASSNWSATQWVVAIIALLLLVGTAAYLWHWWKAKQARQAQIDAGALPAVADALSDPNAPEQPQEEKPNPDSPLSQAGQAWAESVMKAARTANGTTAPARRKPRKKVAKKAKKPAAKKRRVAR